MVSKTRRVAWIESLVIWGPGGSNRYGLGPTATGRPKAHAPLAGARAGRNDRAGESHAEISDLAGDLSDLPITWHLWPEVSISRAQGTFRSFDRRRIARWVLWVALAVHVPIAVVAGVRSRIVRPGSDFDNYYDIGLKPGRPYLDFAVEFPLGTVEAFRAIAPLAGTRQRFGVSLVVLNVMADVAIVSALCWGWGIEAAACYAIAAAPLLDLFLLRLDLWSTAFATLAVAAWRRQRPALAAIGFAAGAAFKLWPLTFLPLLIVPFRARKIATPLATAAAAGIVILGLWLWVAGPLGVYQVLTFRGARGWEVESTVGGLWMLFDRSSMRVESGAWRIGSTIGPISIALFAAGTLTSSWMVWRGARTGHLGAGWAGGIGALLALSALLSPQFAVWMAPAAGIAWAEGDWGVALMTALIVFLTNLEFKSFPPLLRGEPGALFLVLLRNVVLVLFALNTARRLARAPLTPSASADQPTT